MFSSFVVVSVATPAARCGLLGLSVCLSLPPGFLFAVFLSVQKPNDSTS